MPNWCNNVVEISHTDRSKMEALVAAVKDGSFCNFAIPVPQELKDTVAGSLGDPDEQAKLMAQTKANIEKYGAGNWYDFCVNRWGTKWDVDAYESEDIEINEDNSITFGFDSAWAPPVGVYEELESQGFEVRGYYYESGMGFCGVWDQGYDDYFEIGEMSWEEVCDEIPEALDEMFGISETMREYEEMNKDETTQWYEEGVESKGLKPHD